MTPSPSPKILLAALALAAVPLAAVPAGVVAQSKKTVVFNLEERGKDKPRQFYFQANAGPRIDELRWTGWGAKTATATGVYVRDCAIGPCGDGKKEYKAAIVKLTGLRNCPKFANTQAYSSGTMTKISENGSRKTSKLPIALSCTD